MARNLVGLSLSFCVKDIMRGKTTEEEVTTIISGIDAPTDEIWQSVMESYCRHYWYEYPEEAVAVATRLRDAGKIQQPRTLGQEAPTIVRGPWLIDGAQGYL